MVSDKKMTNKYILMPFFQSTFGLLIYSELKDEGRVRSWEFIQLKKKTQE